MAEAKQTPKRDADREREQQKGQQQSRAQGPKKDQGKGDTSKQRDTKGR